MKNPFRKHSSKSANQSVIQRNSVDINITADGQFMVTAMDLRVSTADLEAKIDSHIERLTAFYSQHSASQSKELARLKGAINSVQEDKKRRAYDHSFLNIAEGYEFCALVDNQLGATAWGLAWRTLNAEALQAIMVVSKGQKDLLANSYLDLLFARGIQCLREMVYLLDGNDQNQSAQSSTKMFYSYLLATRKLRLNHWQTSDAIKNTNIAIAYGSVSEKQLRNIQYKIISQDDKASDALFAQIIKDVESYKLASLEPERLKKMVY